MLKYLFYAILFFSILNSSNAQILKVEESESFPEPKSGNVKIFQLKDSRTAILLFRQKDGIDFKVYEASRKLISEKNIIIDCGTKGRFGLNSGVESSFLIGDDIICFVKNTFDKTSFLYRLIIDGKTGLLKKEELIASVKIKSGFGEAYRAGYGGAIHYVNIIIKKDEYSDNYGVALFSPFEEDANKMNELIHFSEDHKIINRQFIPVSNNEFKYSKVNDIVVIGSDKIISSVYMTDRERKSKTHFTLIAILEKGSKIVQLKPLDFAQNKEIVYGILKYNKSNNHLVLITLELVSDKHNTKTYNPVLTLLDTKSYSIIYTKDIELPDLNKKIKEVYGKDMDFNALPQDFYINGDGTYTIVFEELTDLIVHSSNGYNGRTNTYLGNMAVVIFDDKLKEKEKYFIPKNQVSAPTNPFYINRRYSEVQNMFWGIQYKSFAFANSKNGNYIFFNDVFENVERFNKGQRPIKLQGIGAADAFVCKMKDGILSRELLFGEFNKKLHNIMNISVFDYDKELNILVTLKLDIKREKFVKLIWVKL